MGFATACQHQRSVAKLESGFIFYFYFLPACFSVAASVEFLILRGVMRNLSGCFELLLVSVFFLFCHISFRACIRVSLSRTNACLACLRVEAVS